MNPYRRGTTPGVAHHQTTPPNRTGKVWQPISTFLQEFLQQWTKDNPKPDGTRYDLYGDGLRIYTTIDARLQELAEMP